MNSSPASSYARRLELLDAVGEAGGDLAHPVRVDLHARVLHRGEHAGERQLDVAVERVEPALDDAGPERLGARRSVAAARRTSAAVSSSAAGSGWSSTPYSAARSSRSVGRPAGLDQVREEQRVVGRLDPRGLRVVHR